MIGHALAGRVEAALGQTPVHSVALSGGDIAAVWAAEVGSLGQVVIKAGQGLDVEARMLCYLAEHSQLPVPHVHHADSELLIMEKMPGSPGLPADAQEHAAEILASLHGIEGECYGFDFETPIGGLLQDNGPDSDWSEFFAEKRLRPMAAEAARVGRLPRETWTRVGRFADEVAQWIGPSAGPALVHGDAWSGNILCEGGRVAAFIDPAIYHADPEIELAFGTLFGTFDERFFARYAEIRPVREGFFEVRRDLYNLYPLLVHVRLFGQPYVGSVDRILRRFGF